ncbi:MAG: hypothetical protein J6U00_02835 [Ruminococcus sp.]|uniref:hypothetical protein n=1 Tax=Ruminococcus sp. TaxID=41978 RepID=UPI001B2773A7|nr:hypothetical protein [Ruminococcus sp.]MBO7472929.1 hypothetical protein [Ruminococcus sp.]
MDFDVNGEILHIKQNEVLFVNSGRLHFGYSEKKEEVLFELVIVSPELIRNEFNTAALDAVSSQSNRLESAWYVRHSLQYKFLIKNSITLSNSDFDSWNVFL